MARSPRHFRSPAIGVPCRRSVPAAGAYGRSGVAVAAMLPCGLRYLDNPVIRHRQFTHCYICDHFIRLVRPISLKIFHGSFAGRRHPDKRPIGFCRIAPRNASPSLAATAARRATSNTPLVSRSNRCTSFGRSRFGRNKAGKKPVDVPSDAATSCTAIPEGLFRAITSSSA